MFYALLASIITTLIDFINANHCSHNLTITIQFDQYPSENNWELSLVDSSINDTSYSIITRNRTYSNFVAYDTYRESICLLDECYIFNLYDTFGNGMFAYDENSGWFTLYLDNQLITIDKQALHGSQMMYYFCTHLFPTDDNSNNLLTFNIYQYDLDIKLFSFNTTSDDEAYELLLENEYQYPFFYGYKGTIATNTITIADGCYTISMNKTDSEVLGRDAYASIQFSNTYLYTTTNTILNGTKPVLIDFCTNNFSSNFTYTHTINTIEPESVFIFNVDKEIAIAQAAGTGENKVYSTQTVGCPSAGCSVTADWYINGTCDYGRLSISVIETDFYSSSEYVDIYLNNDYIGICQGLDEDCACGLEQCTNVKFYDISDYVNNLSYPYFESVGGYTYEHIFLRPVLYWFIYSWSEIGYLLTSDHCE